MKKFGLTLLATIPLMLGAVGCKSKPAERAGDGHRTSMKPAVPAAMRRGAPMRRVTRKPTVGRLKASNPEAVKLLDAALKAHGGLDALKQKTAASVVEANGRFYGQPFKSKAYWKAPDKMVMRISSMRSVMGYVGKDCWNKQHEVVVDCAASERRLAREMQIVQHWSQLYPLKDKSVSLQLARTPKVNGAETVGLSAARAGSGPRVVLGFFKKTKLLASISYRGHWSGGRKGRLQHLVLGHKKVEGVILPSQTLMSFNGRIIIQEKITKFTLGAVDDKVFTRPKQVTLGKGFVRKIAAYTAVFSVHKGDYKKLSTAVVALMSFMGKARLNPMGGPVFVYLKMGKSPAENVTEIRIPVAPFKGKPPRAKGYGVKKIPATLHALSYVKGPYSTLRVAYAKLQSFLRKGGRRVAGSAHLRGLSDSAKTPPADLLHRISFPIRR